MRWLDSDGKLDKSMEFEVWSKWLAQNHSKAFWAERVSAQGVQKLPPQMHAIAEKGYRRWLAATAPGTSGADAF